MQLDTRISAFVKLGEYISSFLKVDENEQTVQEYSEFHEILNKAQQHNSWFTQDQMRFALEGWANQLNATTLKQWLDNYKIPQADIPKTVAIIMAGNLPLVGFHDFLSVLISGHKVLAKLSSKDKWILPFLAKKLISIEPDFKNLIVFTEEQINNYDAVIATGSNNTSRYFEYYFKNKPNIIRKNRNGIAVLNGDETPEQLAGLTTDIFRFFGMGCRSVSKLYVPEGYDFKKLFNSIYSQKDLMNNHKYINNYDYNKAVYLMGVTPILDNGFVVLKEDTSLSSPIAVIFYEYYNNQENLKLQLDAIDSQIQCIVSYNFVEKEIPFGQAQKPKLWDYADGVDTIAFLTKI